MIYTPAKLRSDVLPRRNTIGLRNHRASAMYQASLVQSTDFFFSPSIFDEPPHECVIAPGLAVVHRERAVIEPSAALFPT